MRGKEQIKGSYGMKEASVAVNEKGEIKEERDGKWEGTEIWKKKELKKLERRNRGRKEGAEERKGGAGGRKEGAGGRKEGAGGREEGKCRR